MKRYIALFEIDKETGNVGVVFPDLPGCFSGGENFDDALRMAHEGLSAHIDWLKRDGDPVPEPRTIERIKAEWDEWHDWTDDGNYMIVPIAYIAGLGKPRKYSLYLDSGLMARIDAVTDNRSAFVTKAVEKMLEGEA